MDMDSSGEHVAGIINDDDLEAFAFLDEVTNLPTTEPQQSAEINISVEPPVIQMNQPLVEFPLLTPSLLLSCSSLAKQVMEEIAKMQALKEGRAVNPEAAGSKDPDDVSEDLGDIFPGSKEPSVNVQTLPEEKRGEQFNADDSKFSYDCLSERESNFSKTSSIKNYKKSENDFDINPTSIKIDPFVELESSYRLSPNNLEKRKIEECLSKSQRRKRNRKLSLEKKLLAVSCVEEFCANSNVKPNYEPPVDKTNDYIQTQSIFGNTNEASHWITCVGDQSDNSEISISSIKTVKRMIQLPKIANADLKQKSPIPGKQTPNLAFEELNYIDSSVEQTKEQKSPNRLPQLQWISHEKPKKRKRKKEKKSRKTWKKDVSELNLNLAEPMQKFSDTLILRKNLLSFSCSSTDGSSPAKKPKREFPSKRKASSSSNRSISLSSNSTSSHRLSRSRNKKRTANTSGNKLQLSKSPKSLCEEAISPTEKKKQHKKNRLKKKRKRHFKSHTLDSRRSRSTSLESYMRPKSALSIYPTKSMRHRSRSCSPGESLLMKSPPRSKSNHSNVSKRSIEERSQSTSLLSHNASRSVKSPTRPFSNLSIRDRNKSISLSPSKDAKSGKIPPRPFSNLSIQSSGSIRDRNKSISLSPPKESRLGKSPPRSKSKLSNVSKRTDGELRESASLSPPTVCRSRSKSPLSNTSKKSTLYLQNTSRSRTPPSKRRNRSRSRKRKPRSRNRRSRSRSARRDSLNWLYKGKRARGIRSNSKSPRLCSTRCHSSSLERRFRARPRTFSRSRSRSIGKFRRRRTSLSIRKRRRSSSLSRQSRSRSRRRRSLSSQKFRSRLKRISEQTPSTRSTSLSPESSRKLSESNTLGSILKPWQGNVPIEPLINAHPSPIVVTEQATMNMNNGYFAQLQNVVPFPLQHVPYVPLQRYQLYNYNVTPPGVDLVRPYHPNPVSAFTNYRFENPNTLISVPALKVFNNPVNERGPPVLTKLNEHIVQLSARREDNMTFGNTNQNEKAALELYEGLIENVIAKDVPSSYNATNNSSVPLAISPNENDVPISSEDDFVSKPVVLINTDRKFGTKPLRERIVINLLANKNSKVKPSEAKQLDSSSTSITTNSSGLNSELDSSFKFNKSLNTSMPCETESQLIKCDDNKPTISSNEPSITLKTMVNSELQSSAQTNVNDNLTNSTEILSRLKSIVLGSKRSVETQVDFLNMGLRGTVEVCDAVEDAEKIALFNSLRDLLKGTVNNFANVEVKSSGTSVP